jgi:hypothetical protein
MIGKRWLTAPWRHRRWTAAAVVVLLVVVRLALPSVLRRVIVSRASRTLHARVEVGAVEMSLWNGRLALREVAVHAPADPGSPADGAPIIGWKLLQAEISYRALLRKLVRLREVVLDTPRVALDRLADGRLNLQELVKAPAAAPETTPPEPAAAGAATSGGFGFALDRFVLRGGGVHFRDLLVPQSQPLEAEIPAIEVAGVAFQPGLYDQPAHIGLDLRSEGSEVRVDAKLKIEPRGIGVDAHVDARSLPLRRARVYVPGVGWSDLTGLADATLDYRLATEAKNEVRGVVTVRELAVRTPGLDEPALAWQQLSVHIDPVDLLERRAAIRLVELKGASVVASLRGKAVLPLVAGGEAPPPPPAPAEAAPATAAPVKPWQWSVADARIEESKLVVDRPTTPLPVAVRLSAADLASEPNAISKVKLDLAIGTGSVEAAGRLRLSPPAFGGTLTLKGLDVREIVAAVPSLPPTLIQSAIVGGEIAVEAGIDDQGNPAADDALELHGTVGVENLAVAAADPKAFNLGWKRLAVAIDDARLPGALAASGAAPRAPIQLAVGTVRLDEPWVALTRTPTGIVLPELSTAETPPAQSASPGPPPTEAPSAPPQVKVASLTLRAGRIAIVDRTVKPSFSSEINPIDLDARGVASVGPAVESFRLKATGLQRGKLEVSGTLKPGGAGNVDVVASRLGLSSLNPYVASASPYRVSQGSVSMTTKVTFTRDRYDTRNEVTVHQIGLQGVEGDTLFRQQFGVPLSTALALLTDLHGDIHLDVPVTIDKGAAKVDFVAVIASALKGAVLGAVLSPLKIIGSVAGLGSAAAGGAIEPPPVAALPGRAEPTSEGMTQVGQLAEFLGSRPGVALDLVGKIGEPDVRWLREQKLRAKLEAGPGIVGSVTGLPKRNARKRILQALVDRAAGKPGEISSEDAPLFEEWLKDIPQPSAEEIRALARVRAERVASLLRDERGIDARRVRAVVPDTVPADQVPGVGVTIGLPSP